MKSIFFLLNRLVTVKIITLLFECKALVSLVPLVDALLLILFQGHTLHVILKSCKSPPTSPPPLPQSKAVIVCNGVT